MGGGPYGRRHRRGHRRSKSHRKCRACREPIGKVTLYGKRIDLPYCQRHHCQKVIGSTVCQEQRNGRNPNWQYCDMRKSCAVLLIPGPITDMRSWRLDLRCQAMSPDGFNCMKSVKDGNPERFKYCSDRKSILNQRHTLRRAVSTELRLTVASEHQTAANTRTVSTAGTKAARGTARSIAASRRRTTGVTSHGWSTTGPSSARRTRARRRRARPRSPEGARGATRAAAARATGAAPGRGARRAATRGTRA